MPGADRYLRGPSTTVVHLITTLGQGGAERVLSQVVPRPDERAGEHHVVVSLVDGGMFADELIAEGVEVRGLGMRPGRDLVRGTLRFARLLRDHRPTMVISWLYHANLLDLLARPFAGEARRARMVWMLRSSLQSPIGVPLHTRATIRLLARLSTVPEAIVVNSRAGRAEHERRGFRPQAWKLLSNGCDTTVFRPRPDTREWMRARLGIRPEAVAAIMVARTHPQKNHETLISALRLAHLRHPEIELLLVGSGTEALDSDHPGSLRIHGLGQRQDVPDLLSACDLLVSSSLTEGLPNSLLEGMASGLVPIVTDVGDCSEVIGEIGLSVPPGEAEALADALVNVLERPESERAALGTLARERVIKLADHATSRVNYASLWRDLR